MSEDTTIRIKKSTREALGKCGSVDDSMNDVIVMLLQNYDESIIANKDK